MQRADGAEASDPGNDTHNEYPPRTDLSTEIDRRTDSFSDDGLPPVDGGRAAIQFLYADRGCAPLMQAEYSI